MKTRTMVGALLLFSASLAACVIEAKDSIQSTNSIGSPSPQLETIGEVSDTGPDEEVESMSNDKSLLIQQAIADLAVRLEVTEEAIQLLSAEAVEWSDTSLGCPQPGVMYAEVIIPGYKVVMKVEEDFYEYHSGLGRKVLCDEEGRLLIAQSIEEATIESISALPTILREEIIHPPYSDDLKRLIDIAIQDLARRLSITPEEINVSLVEKAEWEDTSFGCGDPSLARHPAAIPGYRVVLLANEWEYVYHTDRKTGVIYCPKG